MELVKASTEILTSPITISGMLPRLEAAGRTCYKSEDKITNESSKEFLAKIIRLGHETVLEHESMSVRVVCDRGVTHEMVRHRIASYSQESTRYCDYEGDVKFVIPLWTNIDAGVYGIEWNDSLYGEIMTMPQDVRVISPEDNRWFWTMALIERDYNKLRAQGWSPQQARSILPNSLKTEIVMTCNLREWRHFFKLRCAKAAHPQMREVAIPLLRRFSKIIPVVFEDLAREFNV